MHHEPVSNHEPDPLYVVGSADQTPFAGFGSALTSEAAVRDVLRKHRRGRWVFVRSSAVQRVFEGVRPRDTFHRLLVLEAISVARRELLSSYFRAVVAPGDGVRLVSECDLAEILCSPYAEDLFIGGVADTDAAQVVLFRGNLERLVVPLDWFRSRSGGPTPNPKELTITDGGQTICLGEYEAAADAILYEFDPAARRRQKQAVRRQDDSLGGALRRLRLQKGLRREDFGEVSAKTIARIERREVEKPRDTTLESIARILDVEPDEICSF